MYFIWFWLVVIKILHKAGTQHLFNKTANLSKHRRKLHNHPNQLLVEKASVHTVSTREHLIVIQMYAQVHWNGIIYICLARIGTILTPVHHSHDIDDFATITRASPRGEGQGAGAANSEMVIRRCLTWKPWVASCFSGRHTSSNRARPKTSSFRVGFPSAHICTSTGISQLIIFEARRGVLCHVCKKKRKKEGKMAFPCGASGLHLHVETVSEWFFSLTFTFVVADAVSCAAKSRRQLCIFSIIRDMQCDRFPTRNR